MNERVYQVGVRREQMRSKQKQANFVRPQDMRSSSTHKFTSHYSHLHIYTKKLKNCNTTVHIFAIKHQKHSKIVLFCNVLVKLVLQCFNTLLYGVEAWSTKAENIKNLKA